MKYRLSAYLLPGYSLSLTSESEKVNVLQEVVSDDLGSHTKMEADEFFTAKIINNRDKDKVALIFAKGSTA